MDYPSDPPQDPLRAAEQAAAGPLTTLRMPSRGDAMADLAESLADQAARSAHALAALLDLLQQCPEGHAVPARGLFELLEPICGQVDMVATDALTLVSPGHWAVFPAHAPG